MKKIYLCNVILILIFITGGCGTYGNAIAEQNNMVDGLILGDSNTSEDIVDNEQIIESGELSRDIRPTEKEINSTLTRDEEMTMDIQSAENKINNTPTRDEDTANQIAEIRSQMEEEISAEVSITIQDIIDGKLIIFIENTGDEGVAMGEICIMENKDGNWSEVQRKSNVISELPSYLIQPNNSMRIEFDYVTKYGELSKGLYICIINISGVSIQTEFEIL